MTSNLIRNGVVSGTLRVLVDELDPLMIATALALASLSPGPAGEAGAVAAIAYDIKCKRWYGVALSAVSMVPLFGYIPAIFKVGFLLFLLNRNLNALEAMLPELRESPEASLMVEGALGGYYRKIPDIWLTRRLRQRLGRILDLEKPSATVPSSVPETVTEDASSSTQIPD